MYHLKSGTSCSSIWIWLRYTQVIHEYGNHPQGTELAETVNSEERMATQKQIWWFERCFTEVFLTALLVQLFQHFEIE